MIDLSSIPNVVVGERLGGGAFGDVYRGRHRTLDIDVAVKAIDAAHVTDAERVLREARIMARLDHPNLLRIFDAGQVDRGIYFILEFMDGTCATFRNLPGERTLDLAMQLLAGLQALHQARILHRDIKPANCLVRVRDNRVKIADLGIAIDQATRATAQHDTAGTIPFMAPELFDQPPQFSFASDLYALGITLRCMVEAQDPFPRLPVREMIAWVLRHQPAPVAATRPDLPRPVASAIDKMCARAVSARSATAADAITLLTRTLATSAESFNSQTMPALVGSWLIGIEVEGDQNFEHYTVTHVETGAAGRLALLKERTSLSETAPLMLRSAERASDLSHTGIAEVVDWGTVRNRVYIVTRTQGQSLSALVESSGALPELEALEMTRDLADAVDYLHRNNLVYQVVNPLYAMVKSDARTVQLAWPMFCVPAGSSARSQDELALVSVPLFAAPEALVRPSRASIDTDQQAPSPNDSVGQPVAGYSIVRTLGERAAAEASVQIRPSVDLYGLGETLFYLVAGRAAYAATPRQPRLIFAKMRGPADLRAAVPSVSAPTARLVEELTAPDATRRPPNAAAVRDRLERIARSLRP